MPEQYDQYSLDTPVWRRAEHAIVPLTAMQLWGWKYYCAEGGHRSRRMCATSVRIEGPLDPDALSRSFDALVQRHEALRTRIAEVNGTPQQCIDAPQAHLLQLVDLSALSPSTFESVLKQQAQLFIRKTIDLSIGPLFEARLWRLSDYDHVLIVMLDHIVSDGASYGILNGELWYLYDRSLNGKSTPLPELPVQFADYALWQQCTQADWISRNAAYWQKRLDRSMSIMFPTDVFSSDVQRQASQTFTVPLGEYLTGELRKFARQHGTLLPLAVLSIYVCVIARWCNEDDLLLRFVSHGRHGRRELQGVVGFFASHIHLRIKIEADDTPVEILKKTRAEYQSALEHQDFDRVPLMWPQSSTKITFNWQSASRGSVRTVGKLSIHEYGHGSTEWDLPFYNVDEPVVFVPAFFDTGSDINLLMCYRPDFLSVNTVLRFAADMRAVAQRFITHSTNVVTQ